MIEVSYKFFIIIIIILLGYFLKRKGFLSRKDGDTLARIAFSVTLPALIISSMNDVVLKKSYIIYPIIGVFIGLIMLVASLIVYRKNTKKEKGILTMPLLGLNTGLFGIPLAMAIWGEGIVRYLLLIDIGNAFVIFVLCYIIGAYYANDKEDINKKEILSKVFHSIPLMTYVLTIIIKLFGFKYPKFIVDIADVLKGANTTVSMIALGLFLSFILEKKQIKMIYKYLATKYIIGFTLGMFIFILIPVAESIKIALLVVLILPASFSILPYGVEFGYDRKYLGALINSSIVASIIFMWIIALLT